MAVVAVAMVRACWWHSLLSGNYAHAKHLIGLGIDPEQKCPENYSISGRPIGGLTFLEIASSLKDFLDTQKYEIGQLLIKHGANVEAKFKRTEKKLLQVAIYHGNFKCVDLLVSNGARYDGPEWGGLSPGFCIIERCRTFPIEANSQLEALIKTFRTLFQHGMNPLSEDTIGNNLLHHLFFSFTQSNNLKYEIVGVVKTMVDAGVPVDTPNHKELTPLIRAVIRKDINSFKYLVENGADLNRLYKNTILPVEIAVQVGAVNIVDFLIKNAFHHVNEHFFNQLTLLHRACYKHQHIIIKLLLKKGADVYVKDSSNRTPFSLIKIYAPEHKDSLICMMKHFSEIIFNGGKIEDSDWEIVRKNYITSRILKICKKELDEIVNFKFYHSFTYERMLKIKSDNHLARLAKNNEFLEKFTSNLKLFVFYKNDLNNVLNRAVERKKELEIVYTRLKEIFYLYLPAVVMRIMASHLKVSDLPLTK